MFTMLMIFSHFPLSQASSSTSLPAASIDADVEQANVQRVTSQAFDVLLNVIILLINIASIVKYEFPDRTRCFSTFSTTTWRLRFDNACMHSCLLAFLTFVSTQSYPLKVSCDPETKRFTAVSDLLARVSTVQFEMASSFDSALFSIRTTSH